MERNPRDKSGAVDKKTVSVVHLKNQRDEKVLTIKHALRTPSAFVTVCADSTYLPVCLSVGKKTHVAAPTVYTTTPRAVCVKGKNLPLLCSAYTTPFSLSEK